MKSYKRVVYGYHGMLNFGDDLFVNAVRAEPRILGGGSSPVFVTVPYERRRLAKVFRRPTAGGALLRAGLFLVGLLRTRRVAFVGGSTISKMSGIQRLVVLFARAGIIDLELIGVSIGPFRSEKEREAGLQVVRLSKKVIVRDLPSLSHATSVGAACSFGGDLAALSQLRDDVQKARSEPADNRGFDLGIFPCASAGLTVSEMGARLRALFDGAGLNSSHRVVVVALNSNETLGDTVYCSQLAAEIQEFGPSVVAVDYAEFGIDGFATLIASMRAVVSVRLHGSISAYLSDVPFVNVAYHEKGKDFVDDVGLDRVRCLATSSSCEAWRDAGVSLKSLEMAASFNVVDYVLRAQRAYLG